MEVSVLNLKIRPFSPKDLEELTEFWKEMERDPTVSGNFCLPTDENVARWQRFVMKVHEEDENQVLVAQMGGKLIGYIFFLRRAEFPLVTEYSWASVNELFVHPDYRRRGIATELMKRAFDYLEAMGVTCVRLNVMKDNRAAIGLYRNLGFEEYSLKMEKKL